MGQVEWSLAQWKHFVNHSGSGRSYPRRWWSGYERCSCHLRKWALCPALCLWLVLLVSPKNVVNHQVLPARSKVLDYRLHGDRSLMATFINSEMFLPTFGCEGCHLYRKGKWGHGRKGKCHHDRKRKLPYSGRIQFYCTVIYCTLMYSTLCTVPSSNGWQRV